MALSGREVLLVLRARDEATRTISRVSGAMRRMDRDAAVSSGQMINNQRAVLHRLQRQLGDVNNAYRQTSTGALNSYREQQRAVKGQIAAIGEQRRAVNNAYFQQTQQLQSKRRAEQISQQTFRKGMAEARALRHTQLQQLGNEAAAINRTARANKASYDQAMMQARTLRNSQQEQIRQERLKAQETIRHHERRMRAFKAERDAQRQAGYATMANGAAVTTLGAITAYAGAIGLKAYVSNIQAAMDYETQVRRTMTQTDGVKTSLEELGEVGKRVGKEIPVAFDEVQGGLYDIFSSIDVGMRGANKLITQFSKDAVGGTTDLETATRANLQLMNAYKIEVKDTSRVSDFMFQLVRKGVGTYDEFAKSIGRAIPASVRAGQEMEVLGGMMAFLTRNGLSTAMAATSSARALEAIAHPKTVERMDALGIAVKDAAGEFLPLPEILDNMNKEFGHLTSPQRSAALQELFKGSGGTIQARRFFDNYFKNSEEYLQRTEEMYRATGAAAEAFELMADSPQAKLQQLKNLAKILSVEIGENLLPVAMDVVDAISGLIKAFMDLDPETRRTIYIVGLLTLAGITLTGIITAAVGALMMLVGAAGVVGIGVGALSGIILGVVAAIAALISVTWGAYKNGMFSKKGREQALKSLEPIRVKLSEVWEGVKELAGAAKDLFESFRPALIDGARVAFRLLAVAVMLAADAFTNVIVPVLTFVMRLLEGIPSPIKSIALQAGIAALVLPRLAAALTLVGTGLTRAKVASAGFITGLKGSIVQAGGLRGALARLGGMSRNIAGIGGLLAVTNGASEADTRMGALMTTVGAAAVGFSLGGPLGGALGLLGGAFYSWEKAVKSGHEQLKAGIEFQKEYAETLDQTTGAITRQTREAIRANLGSSGAATVGKMIGIPSRVMIDAAMGDVEAMERVKKRVDNLTGTEKQLTGPNADRFFFHKESAEDFIGALQNMGRELDADQRKLMKAIRDTREWAETVKLLPDRVQTRIQEIGTTPTLKQLRKLHKEYDLTPKEIKTIIKETGAAATVKEVLGVKKSMEDVGKTKPDTGQFEQFFRQGMDRTSTQAKSKSKDIKKNMEDGPKKAKGDVSGFRNDLFNGLVAASSTGRSGGSGVGSAMVSGLTTAVDMATFRVASSAAAMVRTAINAAKKEARTQSPSRETFWIGEMMSQGLADGIAARGKKPKYELVAVVNKAIAPTKGIGRQIYKEITKDLATQMPKMKDVMKIADSVIKKEVDKIKKPKNMKVKDFDKMIRNKKASLSKRVQKELKDEIKQFQKIATRYQNVTKKLKNAQDKLNQLKEAKRAYEDSIKSSITSFGSLGAIETPQDVFGNEEDLTAGYIASQLQGKLSAINQFGSNLKKLLAMGFSKAVYDQVVQMGPEAGGAYAAALVKATPAQVRSINSSTAGIEAAASNISKTAANEMHNAGIAAAEGLVAGLKAREAKLKKQAIRMGNIIAKQIRKALKIKSPSRVAQDISQNFGSSLADSLYKTRKQVSHASHAVAKAMYEDLSGASNFAASRYNSPVVGASGGTGGARNGVEVKQEITIHTQEIDPRRHAAELGWELVSNMRI